MGVILGWYVGSTLIGWFSFPITAHVFKRLPTRGFALTRGLGLLIWGIAFWLLTSWGILNNDLLSQSIVLGTLLLVSIYIGFKWGLKNVWDWFIHNWRMVLGVELVFLFAFLGFSVFRATSSAIVGTEKPMELAFLNAILRSDTFPPHDPWLSGYSISYYYFGYVLVAMLTRLMSVPSTIAYNLAQVLWFSMVAASAYGLLVDLFTIWEKKRSQAASPMRGWKLRLAVLAPVLILLMGNAYGFFDVVHARGVLWRDEKGSAKSDFWLWMDLPGLTEEPKQPVQWQSQRNDTVIWWNASRVVQDTDYSAESVEIIDEFPNFSFLLGDLHPHVLAMPFVMLSIGLALNEFDVSEGKHYHIGRFSLEINPFRFLLSSGLIGALAFLNTWDWPIYAALYSVVFLINRIEHQGWKLLRLTEFFVHGSGMLMVGVLLYLPFFLNFASQASGFLPSIIYFTKGVHFWVMFFPYLPPLICYLLWITKKRQGLKNFSRATLIMAGFLGLLVVINVAFAVVVLRLDSIGELFMANQGANHVTLSQLFLTAGLRRLISPGTWLTLCILLVLCLSNILSLTGRTTAKKNSIHLFVLLLVLFGGLLTLLPEFVYLLDAFGKRMNTIFKFYFQSWILWSLSSAFGIGVLWSHAKSLKKSFSNFQLSVILILSVLILVILAIAPSIQMSFGGYLLDWLWILLCTFLLMAGFYFVFTRRWLWLFRLLVFLCLGVGVVYPLQAISSRSGGFSTPDAWTLDGSEYYRKNYPELMAAVDRMWAVSPGVLAEAIAPDGGDYSIYGRVAMLTGMPAVLGWRFHEVQWRGGDTEIGPRQADVALLYETLDWRVAQGVIDKYNIKYIYMGDLEQETYDLQEEKFYQHLELIFQEGKVVVFQTELE